MLGRELVGSVVGDRFEEFCPFCPEPKPNGKLRDMGDNQDCNACRSPSAGADIDIWSLGRRALGFVAGTPLFCVDCSGGPDMDDDHVMRTTAVLAEPREPLLQKWVRANHDFGPERTFFLGVCIHRRWCVAPPDCTADFSQSSKTDSFPWSMVRKTASSKGWME
ncbi:MAG: hypothetical protein M1826_005317 [Phylliscum demangeonii]|nr:MAG: hypothetical protein M1826_005317 [Phylliscum demangeonii]